MKKILRGLLFIVISCTLLCTIWPLAFIASAFGAVLQYATEDVTLKEAVKEKFSLNFRDFNPCEWVSKRY
jgi:hypothetical protein